MRSLEDVVVLLLVLVDLRRDIVESEFALLAARQQHIGEDARHASVAILEGMNADKPKMGNRRANNAAQGSFAVKPGQELRHLRLDAVGRGGDVVHLLASEHAADDVLLMGAIPSHLYLTPFAESKREKCRLPGAKFRFAQGLVVVLDGF